MIYLQNRNRLTNIEKKTNQLLQGKGERDKLVVWD